MIQWINYLEIQWSKNDLVDKSFKDLVDQNDLVDKLFRDLVEQNIFFCDDFLNRSISVVV